MSDTQQIELNEIDPVEASFYAEYEEAASPRTLPPDGAYQVRMPDDLPDSAFQVRADNTGKRYLSITLDPLTVVGGEHDGAVIRFLRVTTKPIVEFVKKGDGWEPGRTLNASDANDVLVNFGTGDTPTNVDEWKQAFRRLCGQTSPHPFYLVWNGYDKLATGKAKYLKSKDFPVSADGTRPSTITRTNPATNQTYTVFANMALGRRGAFPKK